MIAMSVASLLLPCVALSRPAAVSPAALCARSACARPNFPARTASLKMLEEDEQSFEEAYEGLVPVSDASDLAASAAVAVAGIAALGVDTLALDGSMGLLGLATVAATVAANANPDTDVGRGLLAVGDMATGVLDKTIGRHRHLRHTTHTVVDKIVSRGRFPIVSPRSDAREARSVLLLIPVRTSSVRGQQQAAA